MKTAAWIALLALVFASCADRNERLKKRLAQRGYAFAVSEFLRAAESGDAESVTDFLGLGVAVDAPSDSGKTAFIAAAESDRSEAQIALLRAGAKPDQRLSDGRTALLRWLEGQASSAPVFDALLKAGASPSLADSRGRTPVVMAASHGKTEALRRLLPLDFASLDPALLAAAAHGQTSCLDVLAKAGAYLNVRDAQGKTPLALALDAKHTEAVELLVALGADAFGLKLAGLSDSAAPSISPSPPPSLDGQTLPSPLAERVALGPYHERLVPLLLLEVNERSAKILFQHEDGRMEELIVAPETMMPGASFLARQIRPANDSAPATLIVDDGQGQTVSLRPKKRARDVPATWMEWSVSDVEWAAREGDEFQVDGVKGTFRIAKLEPHRVTVIEPSGRSLPIERQPPGLTD